MKNYILLLFLVLGELCMAVSNDVSDKQKQDVREIASIYFKRLSTYSYDPNNNTTEPILQLFSNPRVYVFDDITDEDKMFIGTYLENIDIKKYSPLSISLLSSIENTNVFGLQAPNPSKSNNNAFASIEMSKKISGSKINKTTKNRLIIDLNTFKIIGISKNDLSNEQNLSPFELWLRGLEDFNKAQNRKPEFYRSAKEFFKKSAKQGYAPALTYLGIMYNVGYGGEQNCNEAITYFKLSDAQNELTGSLQLANAYIMGNCIDKDVRKGISIYEKTLSIKRNKYALYSLGVIYANGYGVVVNKKKAIQYFEECINIFKPDGNSDTFQVDQANQQQEIQIYYEMCEYVKQFK